MTALKKAERDDALVVRLLNIANSDQEGTVTFGKPPASVQLANLNEEPQGELAVDGASVTISARPKQLVTLLVKFSG